MKHRRGLIGKKLQELLEENFLEYPVYWKYWPFNMFKKRNKNLNKAKHLNSWLFRVQWNTEDRIVRKAWKSLTVLQQQKLDKTFQVVIKRWEKKYQKENSSK
jgi:hypothetical protein